MVLQTKWQDQLSKTRNEERRTLLLYIQMLELPQRSSSQLQCIPFLVPLFQQEVPDEVFWDPWEQVKIHPFWGECHESTMNLKSLKILLQTLLETQKDYDIILI